MPANHSRIIASQPDMSCLYEENKPLVALYRDHHVD